MVIDTKTQEEPVEMKAHQDLVRTVQFNHETKRIISGSYDSALIVGSETLL
jgi:hypothetical protein